MKYSTRVAALEKKHKPALRTLPVYTKRHGIYYDGIGEHGEIVTESTDGIVIHFAGDTPDEMYDIWDGMQIPRGSESWDWRVQTYIRDKGLST